MNESQRASRTLVLLAAVTFLLAVAGLTIGLVPFELIRAKLDALAGDGSADPYTVTVHRRFQLAGFALFGLSALALALQGYYRSQLSRLLAQLTQMLVSDSRQLIARSFQLARAHAITMLVLMTVAAVLRLPYLTQPLRYDEAHTVTKYANKIPALIVTQYDEPNNHIFHSLLVHAAIVVCGDQPAALRLPVFVSGILVVGLTFCLGTVCLDVATGRAAGIVTAAVPQMIFYSANARGYMIATALFLTACLCAREAIGRRYSAAWLLVAVALALSIWTVPTMIYGAMPIWGWLCCKSLSSPALHGRWLVVTIAGALLTVAVLYAAVILSIGLNRFLAFGGSRLQSIDQYLAVLPEALVNLYRWIAWGIPTWIQAILAVCLMVAVTRIRRSHWPLAASIATVPVALLLQRVVPPERTWCFAIPMIALVSAVGMYELVGFMPIPKRIAWGGEMLAGVACLGIVVPLVASDAIRNSSETGLFPEGEQIVATLARTARPAEPIAVVTPASATILYYSRNGRLAPAHFMPPGTGYTDDSSALVVTSRAFDQSIEDVLGELKLSELFSAKTAVRIAEFETADIFRVGPK